VTRRDRVAIGEKILSQKETLVRETVEEFLDRHRARLDRWDQETIRRFGREDVAFHVDFLVGALEQSSPSAFHSYLTWTVEVLESRGISRSDLIENIEQIENWLEQNLLPKEFEVLKPYFLAGYHGISVEVRNGGASKLGAAAQVYVQSLLQANRQTAFQVLEGALSQGASLENVYVNIIQPAMYEVGRLWETSQISVAEEHMATAIAQFTMGRMYEHLVPPSTSNGRVLVTGVQGELHQIGANMVADVLEMRGWEVRFLGTNLPEKDILSAVQEFQPNWVGISTTMLFNTPTVRRLIEAIRRLQLPTRTKIALGGAAFKSTPNIHHTLGADAQAACIEELSNVFGDPFPVS